MKKIKLIKILAGFFALMLLFTFLSRAADSVNVAQVETKTAQNQVITHEVTGTGKVMDRGLGVVKTAPDTGR